GIHLAIKSGMLAAETIFEALLKQDFSRAELSTFRTRFDASWAHKEMWGSRNFHQGFEGGLYAGMFFTGIETLTGGWAPFDGRPTVAGHEQMKKLADALPPAEVLAVRGLPTLQKKFTKADQIDKLGDLYLSGTQHEEDQPAHLVISPEDVANI